MAEAEPFQQHHLAVGGGDHFPHQVLAGDAEMHRAGGERFGDFGGGEERHLDAVEPRQGAAIIARTARLDEVEAGAGEERLGILLQPAFRRHRKDERAHAMRSPLSAARRSIHAASPTAGTGSVLPRRVMSVS